MRTFILLIFIFTNGFLFSQDTTVTWIKNIDTLTYKMLYARKHIPKEAYKVIGMDNKNDIAIPANNWTPSCMARPHRGLNWIAKDKNHHLVISVTYGGKAAITKYFFLDKEKGKVNINEIVFNRKRLTFGQTVSLIKSKEYKFEVIDFAEFEKH